MDEVVAIVGPTASGKTELALALAKRLGGEIVGADSRQVYRELDAATAKPPRDARGLVEGVAYHLLDCVSPDRPFSAGDFARLAGEALRGIRARGRLPIVCGGTGLYVRALEQGLAPLPRRDDALRRRLQGEAESLGRRALHERLAAADPEAARAIPANNIQRVIRALEVWELTGRPMTELWKEGRAGASAARWTFLLVDPPDARLRERIEARARAVWPALLAEVGRLVPARWRGDEPGFQSLGYPEALACLRGELSGDEALERMLAATRAYAKRQRTWFRGQCRGAVPLSGSAEALLEAALAAAPAGAGA